MLTKPLLLALLAACGVRPATATAPDDQPLAPPETEEPPEDQHFCCQSVDHKNKTGDGCTAISGSLEVINSCNKVLYCPGFWTKDDGVVTCD
jgi:hypothetical protein